MARIENGSQPNAWLKGLNHDAMHFIIHNVSSHSEIDWIDDFIVSVLFITIQIFGLSAMTYGSLDLNHD